jgi:hypothetical protein
MNTLEDRIARLERKNRFLQCFVILAFVGMGLMGFNYSPQETITTRELKIVSPAGKTVALLGSDEDGGLVKVFNKSSEMTSFLFCTGKGGAIAMYQDGHPKPVASLSATDNGGHLSINNKEGESAAAITVLENRGGVVGTFKAEGGEISWTSPSE